jgi:glucose-fructose oxidoreductase
LLQSGEIDAVYIAVPNSLHHEFALLAASHKVHVLCEKPLAANPAEAKQMIQACKRAKVKLMTAYRLHFEAGNLAAIDQVRTGRIGEPRLFSSVFTQQVAEGNTRLEADLAGSPLMDIGIYCINAARYLFRDDPIEVSGFAASNDETRFSEVPEMISAVLRFSKERIASFTVGFGEASVSEYRIVGTTGDLRLEPAYGFTTETRMHLTVGDNTEETKFARRDQVGAEILYFSECILKNRKIEPDGMEGLADLAVIDALERSIKTNRPAKLRKFRPRVRPSRRKEIKLPPVKEPELINAAPPSGNEE